MSQSIKEAELNHILKDFLKKVFENKSFKDLSSFQRRQCVFDYIVNNNEYNFILLGDIYSGKKREFADEIISVLDLKKKNKGVCHSFSYSYKLALDKLKIPNMLSICYVLEKNLKEFEYNGLNTLKIKQDDNGFYMIPHMIVLVQNEDKTFSFDDITYAIFNKKNEKKYEFFNYDYKIAEKNRQCNLEGFDTSILKCIIKDYKDTDSDKLFREKYKKRLGFLNIPSDLVKRYDEKSKNQDLEDERTI